MNYEILKFENMEYVKVYPNDYKEGEKRPVLLLLHGWGPLADRKIEGRVNDSFFPITNTVNKYPFIILSPLCPKDMWFDCFETLERFLKYAFTADFTDPERLYIMGASMGGYATWQLAMSLYIGSSLICDCNSASSATEIFPRISFFTRNFIDGLAFSSRKSIAFCDFCFMMISFQHSTATLITPPRFFSNRSYASSICASG